MNMRAMLMLIILVLVTSDILGIDIGLAPGLSVKNLLLYLGFGLLLLQKAVTGRPPVQMGWLQGAFLLLILYAAASIVLNVVVLELPGYRPAVQLVTLKTQLLDRFIVFLLFFYATRTLQDVHGVLGCLLVAVAIACLFTITNVAGLTSIGPTLYGADNEVETGRIYGYFGHANETGTLMVTLIPAYMAMTERSAGLARAAWLLCLAAAVLMLVMTGSRGAMVGLAVGGGVVAFAYRRYFDGAGVRRWMAWSAMVLLPLLLVVGWQFVQQLTERIAIQASGHLGDASSGRTELWADALEAMLDSPWTFLTGFGWGGWDAHAFRYVAHNSYLSYWFDLGLPGLVALLVMLLGAVLVARRALPAAGPGVRGQLIAFIAGMASLLVALAFLNLYSPWPYVWAYIALMMRLALIVGQPAPAAVERRPVIGMRPVAAAAPLHAMRRT